jgi:hypothetical protein
LLGVLKLVIGNAREPLPMENELGITLPSNGGLKIEPSNFAIRREFNQLAFDSLLIQLLGKAERISKDSQIDPNAPLFFTYGDRTSKMMYTALGFKISKSHPQSFTKEGRDWWVLSASLKDILSIPSTLSQKRTQEDIDTIKRASSAIAETSIGAYGSRGWYFQNLNVKQGRSIIPERLSLLISNMDARNKMVTLQSDLVLEGVQANFVIPKELLPLKRGNWSVFGGKQQLEYDGVNLHLTMGSPSGSFEVLTMKVDPHFSQPTAFHYLFTIGGRTKIDISGEY